jgi:hypothetical protein
MPPLDVPVRLEAEGAAEKVERGGNVAIEEVGDDLRGPWGRRHRSVSFSACGPFYPLGGASGGLVKM